MIQKLLVAALAWVMVAGGASGQTTPAAESIAPAVRQLLPAGVARVAIMDSVVWNPRLDGLMRKFQEGVRANPQYLVDIQQHMAKQGPGSMPYDKRSGLTEPEYREFQALIEKRDMKVAAAYVGELTIRYQGETIRFAGTGRLKMLNDVWIDLAGNEVHFSNYTLPFAREVAVTDAQNAFDSAWTAYKWELMEPAGETFEDLSLEKLRTMNALRLELQVGRLAKTGKTFIKLQAKRMDNGTKKYWVDTPMFFQ